MKINDKVIVAFMVSVGMFSAVNAARYVGSMSVKQRKSIAVVINRGAMDNLLCSDNTRLNDNNKTTTA